MKIRILMFSLLGLMFFNSCSNDNDSSGSNSNNSSNSTSQNLDPNTILPKKVIITGVNIQYDVNLMYQTGIYEFFYNKNKIDYIKFTNNIILEGYNGGNPFVNVENIYFTYTGDLITQISYGSVGSAITENFYYQNNQLTKVVSKEFDLKENTTELVTVTRVYNYNSDGTINYNSDSTNFYDKGATYTLYNGLATTASYYFSFDTYSPFKNIIGIEKIFLFPYVSQLKNLFLYPKNTYKENRYGIENRYSYTFNDILFPTSFFGYSPVGAKLGLSYSIFYY